MSSPASYLWKSTHASLRLFTDFVKQNIHLNEAISPKTGDTLRIMQFNIQGHLLPSKSAENLTSLTTDLNRLTPDICLFEEVIPSDPAREKFDQLLRQAGYHYLVESEGSRTIGNMIVSKVPISDPRFVDLGDGRSIIMVGIQWKDVMLTVVCTHLEPYSAAKRIDQTGILVKVLREINGPIFLAGDMNAEITAIEMQILKSNLNLNSVFQSSLPNCTIWDGRAVDQAFINQVAQDQLNVMGHVYYTFTSDHLPLIVDFTVKEI